MKQSLSHPPSPLAAVAALGGTAHTSQILAAGVHPRALYAARETGTLVEVSRGVFRLAELPLTEPDLVAAVTRMPKAVICCISALHFHGLTQEIPRAVHVSLPRGVHPARLTYPPIEVYHVAAPYMSAGVDTVLIDGIPAQITAPARSVSDAFKFRRRLGLETALDALRRALSTQACSPAEIDAMAKFCRVQAVVRPYLEALA